MDGEKTFEIRFNDRNYQPGDELTLQETKHSAQAMADGQPLAYTGRYLVREVTHVMRGPIYGLMDGWAILSIQAPAEAKADKKEGE